MQDRRAPIRSSLYFDANAVLALRRYDKLRPHLCGETA
jgi:hypothetical protein